MPLHSTRHVSAQVPFLFYVAFFSVAVQGFLFPTTAPDANLETSTAPPSGPSPSKTLGFGCGQSTVDPASTRIFGGHKAQPGAWPWLVLITDEGYQHCQGAILNETIILTATHCVRDHFNELDRWQVHAGKLRTDRTEPGQMTVNVSKIIRHKNFTLSTVANDIALLVLAQPLSFSALIRPICLPDVTDVPRPGEMCLLAGWGDTEHGYKDKISLNQVSLPIIADDVCSRPEWLGNEFLPQTTFCAGYEEGGKDGCNGDSGSPLICKTGDRWVVKGISSWGYGCASRLSPGVYTNVIAYLPWIESSMATPEAVVTDSALG